jgi:hypothetical protein
MPVRMRAQVKQSPMFSWKVIISGGQDQAELLGYLVLLVLDVSMRRRRQVVPVVLELGALGGGDDVFRDEGGRRRPLPSCGRSQYPAARRG